ncbi:MAG: response regulator transcription factor [Candidatus Margulisiibacteriota bacterium]|nr:response regulator transcription factor [Candidatus Margulisiibacteriota bacterium]
MINVCCIDDHQIVREGIKKILCYETDIQIVCEYDSPKQLLNQVVDQNVNVILLDLSFGESYGDLSLIEIVKSKFKSASILVFSMLDEQVFGLEVLNYGVKGFLSKNSHSADLAKAIRVVNAGRVYVSEELSQELAINYSRPKARSVTNLSVREKEVLVLLGTGVSLNAIAEQLHISGKTVSTYKRRIFDKLELQNNADLIHFCVKNKLILAEV